jgi:hypothetical protein
MRVRALRKQGRSVKEIQVATGVSHGAISDDTRDIVLLERAWEAGGTFFDPLPPRPKGMHCWTYQRLRLMYARHHHASVMEFFGRFGMLPDEVLELA